ncbi:hypothetical protein GGE07_006072 [Sinorhizobium terangae]|uniref:ApeA N-terminal domain-containing protein n=1 Tax=Sinorhizobium terangae TaxID=110322 RepID=A0A6N7LD32_SINTE|nr:hypothetical protein [Sinorhizobium terangae]MBB4189390.1 hypothetical protein [Sinorhizobium terangae]MQX15767.1 hypothetical protein [Sinorhizobium terangae]
MPRTDFETTVTVKLLHPDRGDSVFSAILERDPHFLRWNRMSLIGGDDDYGRFLGISVGQLEWELYDNPDWPNSGGSQPEHRTFGAAILTRSGRAGGTSIARDGIQKFADLAIHRHVETLTISDGKLSAIYEFLQRPPTWYAYPRRLTDALYVRGEWRSVPSLGLKLRLLTSGYRRKDSRISQEVELIEIPGVEVQPITDMPPEAFITAAEDLWFSIRVLLMYRFRQSITALTEQVSTSDTITTTWHHVEVEPRQEARDFDSIDFFGRVDDFLAQAAPRLAAYRDQSGLLHAAAWGYAASFGTSVLNAQLTDRVEAIERLVAVYEKTSDLDRDRVSREMWKPIKSALKRTLDDLDIAEELAGHLKRGFASSPTLTLQERIERMAARYSDQWNQEDQGLLKGLNNMIAARNAIVHGRLVDNIDRLAVERLRAQVIFEKLFMSFLGCDEYYSSGHVQLSISSLEQRLAGL